MHFAAIFAAVSLAVSSVTASPLNPRDVDANVDALSFDVTVDADVQRVVGFDLSASNFYGAPYPPWVPESFPGWYVGDHSADFPELPCLVGLICKLLELLPFTWLHCPMMPPTPPPSDGYHQTFSNLSGATQAGDYLTYGLVDTVAQCKAMCDTVAGCKFVNSYYDVNGKGGSTQLTCSLFSSCHTSSDAINIGGQTQPDGSIDYISESNGFCKD